MTATTTETDPEARPTPSWLPLGAVAVTLLAWASAFVAIRHLGHGMPPGALSLGRLLVAVLALGAMTVARRGPRPPTRREWPLVVVGGVSWIGVYNVALNAGEQRIDAGTAALVVQVGPILVALFATVFLGERLTGWLVTGLAVGFGGVALIARSSAGAGHGDLSGVLLVGIAALTFAVGVLTQKVLLVRGMGALEMTFWFYVVGAVSCLPFSGQLLAVVRHSPGADLAWLAYLGVVPSAIAFTTWAYALSRADAGKFALTTFLVPFITTLLAWLLLGEVPAGLAFVGGALCIVGVLLTRRPSRQTRRAGRS